MTRKEKIFYWGGLFVLVMLFGVWGVLYYVANYVRNIPSRRLPFSSYFTGNLPRLYEWLSDVLSTVLQWSLISFLVISVILIFIRDLSESRTPLSLLILLLDRSYLQFISQFLSSFLIAVREALFGLDWTGTLITRFLLICALYIGYHRAKTVHWDWLRWFVLPSAKVLAGQAGGPDAKPDEELIRYLMDTEAGLNKSSWLVEAGELKLTRRATGPAARFGGPGILITQEGHAVILEKSGGVSRVVGRGITYLEPFERPTMAVKLTTQAAKLEVKNAFTRDGGLIEKIEALIFCKLDAGRANIDRGTRYPFDDALIIKLVWDPKRSDPKGAVESICTTVLYQVISKHTLQEFFDDFEQMRIKIHDELMAEAGKAVGNFLGYRIIAVAINQVQVPPATEQKLWERWRVVQDVTIDTTRAHGEWQIQEGKANTEIGIRSLQAALECTIALAAAKVEQENKLLVAGTELENTENKAKLDRELALARMGIDRKIALVMGRVEQEKKLLAAGTDREIEMKYIDIDLELKQLNASNERKIKRLNATTDIEIDQDRRHASSESELERLKLLSQGEKFIESSGSDIRIELFTNFVRMIQLAGHEPSEDTLRELAKVLLTSQSPRGTAGALRRLLYRAIAGRATPLIPGDLGPDDGEKTR